MKLENWMKKTGVEYSKKIDNLTVGGSLYLEGTGITQLPDNLTVGGYLYLRGTGITDISKVNRTVNHDTIKRTAEMKLKWDSGYRIFDGIFCKVVKQIGNTYKVEIKGNNAFIIDDGKYFSHGKTLKEAHENLVYKRCARDKSEYEDLTIESEIYFSDAVEMYRVITGACEFGVRNFVSGIEKREKYKISEIITLTKNQYGSDSFSKFFKDFV